MVQRRALFGASAQAKATRAGFVRGAEVPVFAGDTVAQQFIVTSARVRITDPRAMAWADVWAIRRHGPQANSALAMIALSAFVDIVTEGAIRRVRCGAFPRAWVTGSWKVTGVQGRAFNRCTWNAGTIDTGVSVCACVEIEAW